MGAFVGAVLMCHAPIVVPRVGETRGDASRATTSAMRDAARFLVDQRPDVVVVISPHTPRPPRAFSVVDEGTGVVRGDFGRFGVPEVGVRFRHADVFADALTKRAHLFRVDDPLDHGALVPLVFLAEEGFEGAVIVLGIQARVDTSALVDFGRAIRQSIDDVDARVALLASGDMSHRLIPGAPSGFHEDGARFDRAVVERIAARDLDGALALDEEMREHAAEDVVESLAVARGVIAKNEESLRVFSYEGPYGVGYLVAELAKGAHDEEGGA